MNPCCFARWLSVTAAAGPAPAAGPSADGHLAPAWVQAVAKHFLRAHFI